MNLLTKLPEIFFHLDKYLDILIKDFGVYSYVILFFVIFMETGFVVTPFLPGDSILFASGAFAALGSLNVIYVFIILFIAGVGIMKYPKFILFNILGGFLWTAVFIFAGYYFGNIDFVKNNFEIVVLAIVFISIIPMIIEVVKSKIEKVNNKD